MSDFEAAEWTRALEPFHPEDIAGAIEYRRNNPVDFLTLAHILKGVRERAAGRREYEQSQRHIAEKRATRRNLGRQRAQAIEYDGSGVEPLQGGRREISASELAEIFNPELAIERSARSKSEQIVKLREFEKHGDHGADQERDHV